MARPGRKREKIGNALRVGLTWLAGCVATGVGTAVSGLVTLVASHYLGRYVVPYVRLWLGD